MVVLIVVASVGGWLFVIVANIPGNLAKDAGHPQQEAIRWLGWLGLLTGVGWFAALIWAKFKPKPGTEKLAEQVRELEARLAALEAGQ